MRQLLLVATIAFFVAACGFAPRSFSIGDGITAIGIPANLPRDTKVAIERETHRLGIEISHASNSLVAIDQLIETVGERAIGFDEAGHVREYRLNVHWEITARSVVDAPIVINSTEIVAFGESSLIGFDKERKRTLALLREQNARSLFEELLLWLPKPSSATGK
ncbi:MAG: hypothetical protein F4W90_00380 [Gammaproteobacteria bacterium]|nr:hypothetical protein [Gammaproteobacteria bacterium]